VQVILVRHAEAVDETLALRDPYRHLTPRGRQQARALGDRLRWHDCVPTKIWTSPLVRAVQTAELVAIGLACSKEVEIVVDLAPDGNARQIEQTIKTLPEDAAVMLVGHEPSLSAIGSLIIGAELDALEKAQAVRILDGVVRWRFAWDAEAPTVVGGKP
jgi:phosphohistidine phosphatase